MRGIRTCRGGASVPFTDAPPGFLPRAKPRGQPSVRPSSLPPPPTWHPNLKNSNREPQRLEINVTQTKQTPEPHSNRELEALFQTGSGLMIQPSKILSGLSIVSAIVGKLIQPGEIITNRPSSRR